MDNAILYTLLLTTVAQSADLILGQDIEAWSDRTVVATGDEVTLTCRVLSNTSESLTWRLRDTTSCVGCYSTPGGLPTRKLFEGDCQDDAHYTNSSCAEDGSWLTNTLTVILTGEDIREWFCVSETKPLSASVLLETNELNSGLLVGGVFAGIFIICVVVFVALVLYKTREPPLEEDTEPMVYDNTGFAVVHVNSENGPQKGSTDMKHDTVSEQPGEKIKF